MALNDSQGEQQLVLKVSGLPRGLDDSLIGYFENCPDGSIPIEAMHRVRGDCFVTFKNQRDARAAARKRLTIKGHELTVELLKNSESDVSLCDSTCSDITILSECNSDLGFAICQQRQTTTGSGMAKMQQPEHINQVDDDVTDEACESRAYSGISSPDVEESILIMDEDFEYCYPGCLSDASERKVLVHAMNGVCDEELIHLLFSNKEKYNGGPIQEMTIAADLKTALITFCDKQDADNILNREQVEFMGKVYKTSKPVLTTIKLSDVPACMTSDMLTVLLEENKGSSFSSCPDITIDRENREAIVTFGDASEADKIAECSKIVYASMKVEKRAKTYVENFLYAVPRRVVPVSVTTKTLLSGCESKDPILSRMNGRFVYWEASGEGHAVCIYALDEGDIDRWIAEIGHVIKEHKKNIDNILENDLRRVIANLEHRFPGRLSVLRNSNSELEFSVFWDVETDVLRMFNQLTRKDVGFNKKRLFYPK
ncbi:hypothetical protein CAPTEDRAFT_209285 [Capitella teleta]|uniref:RRM domain-containing protein n=1 Tax=Capitella teleta TaxID=283909 RepID=R7UGV3_CAPTE|nr:hypothetical protein CAPTEDRAFT_209285 [Capitella teleta]|eukprot:ELU05774.1 hypothetical protein CAPTEDRAFT_209285 [Capitella teleta]